MKGTADETLVVGDMNFDVDMAHHAGCKASNEEVDSIWEKKVLDHVHPDDVTEKITRELALTQRAQIAEADVEELRASLEDVAVFRFESQ